MAARAGAAVLAPPVQRADAVIVPSRAIEQRLGEYGVTTPMHILPTGISLSTMAEGGRWRSAKPRNRRQRPVALFVGRVAHEKNIDYLLDVVDQMRAWVPDILLIAGDGPACHCAELRRARLAACRAVHRLPERQAELPACCGGRRLRLRLAHGDPGLVLPEAMAAGLPVVALAEMGTVDILGAGRGAGSGGQSLRVLPLLSPTCCATAGAAPCAVGRRTCLRCRSGPKRRWPAGWLKVYRDIIRGHGRQRADFSFSTVMQVRAFPVIHPRLRSSPAVLYLPPRHGSARRSS